MKHEFLSALTPLATSMAFRRALQLVLAAALSVSVLASPLERRAGLPILLSNDDGWAEANIRELYKQAKAAGYNVRSNALQPGSYLTKMRRRCCCPRPL